MKNFFLLAFIGGSGIYQIEELRNQKWIKVSTPWGSPSDKILTGSRSRSESFISGEFL